MVLFGGRGAGGGMEGAEVVTSIWSSQAIVWQKATTASVKVDRHKVSTDSAVKGSRKRMSALKVAFSWPLICALAGCQPFVPTQAPTGAPTRSPTEVVVEDYVKCVYMYAEPRLNYEATVDELADAAIGACKAKLAEVRSVYIQVNLLSYADAERFAWNLERDTRARLIPLVLDARNNRRNLEPPTAPSAPAVAGTGTAFAVINSRTLATAYHVIQGSRSVEVSCGGGKKVQAVVEKIDPANDLALLSITTSAPAFLELAADGAVKTGQRVFTIGFPVPDLLGMEPKYTEGSVSSTTGIGGASNLLQITVPVQPGNSGGPLVDTHGRLVGVITSSAAVVAFLRFAGTLPQSVNWAVRGEYLRLLLDSLPHAGGDAAANAVDRVKASVCLVTTYQ